MDTTRSSRDATRELAVSGSAVAVGLIAVGTLLAFTAEFGATDVQSTAAGLIAIALGGAVWAGVGAQARWAPALAVVGVQALTLLIVGWVRNPIAVGLLALPPTLAAVLWGPAPALLVGLLDTLLLPASLAGLGLRGDPFSMILGAVLVWSAPLLVMGTYRQAHQLGDWLAGYYETTRRMLVDARAQELELGQLRDKWRNALRQLSIANERLATLRQVAEDARESKAAFVAEVSHEFRTPLNIIIGMVSLMVEAPDIYEDPFPPHAMEQLRTVYQNCRHLAAMIDDVLDLSRVEAGRMTLHREHSDVGALVETTLAAVRPLTSEKGLWLRSVIAEDLPSVYCDATRIRQIVLNLLSNAARLTDAGGVEVAVARRDGKVRISVGDTGPGIAPEESQDVFQPFRQGAGATWRDRKGTGLGLNLSRTFVQLHGGTMWFESEVGVGTTFHVDLPIAGPPAHAARPDRWIRRDWMWREDSFHTEQVGRGSLEGRPRLVVVDESGGLSAELGRHSDGVEFVVVDDPASGGLELAAAPAHGAILNARSPDGIVALIEEARKLMPGTPLVGCSCPPRAQHALELGAAGYLVKPVLRNDLAVAIRSERGPAGSPAGPIRSVLIVDDEDSARCLLASYVRAIDPTIEVIEAADGENALLAMRTAQPDLVLLDVLMPGTNGWDVLRAKSRDETIKDIPVVVVSAQDARENPPSTPFLVAAYGDGVSVSTLLSCVRQLSSTLLGAS